LTFICTPRIGRVTSLLTLADERFISLTTFRRSGEPVSTPVWVGRDGEAIVVLTPADSGKVKRLRHDPRVEVRPCGRFGKVAEGAQPVAGIAELRAQPADVERVRASIRSAYPIESRVVLGLERLVERLRGRPRTTRLGVYITPAAGGTR
jgi:uncharacterized protein